MAFPTVSDVTATVSALNQQTHTIDLPATVNAGDLLLLFIGGAHSLAATPADWTELLNETGLGVYALDAAGTEDGGTVGIDFGVTNSDPLAAHVMRISAAAWSGTLATDVDIASVDGNSKFPDWASVTAGWGSDDNLFVAVSGAYNDDQHLTNPPANYTDLLSSVSGGGSNLGCSIASMTRELASDADDPPAADRYASAQIWRTATLVVKPAAAAGTTFEVTAADGVSLGDSPGGALTIAVSVADGIAGGDSPGGPLSIPASLTDGVALADTPGGALTLAQAIADGTIFADAPSPSVTYSLTLADGLVLSDEPAAGAISVSVADGISTSDAASAANTILAAITDGLQVSDSVAGALRISATIADGVSFSDAIATAITYVLSIQDGVSLGDVAVDTSILPVGLVSVTITARKASITITARRPETTVSASKPGIGITGRIS